MSRHHLCSYCIYEEDIGCEESYFICHNNNHKEITSVVTQCDNYIWDLKDQLRFTANMCDNCRNNEVVDVKAGLTYCNKLGFWTDLARPECDSYVF